MRNTLKALFVVLVLGLLMIRPASAYADWHGQGGGHGNWHGGGNGNWHGNGGHWHNRGYSYVGIDLSLWPAGYYYNDPYYYGGPYYSAGNAVLVTPPANFQPVVINGTTYYVNNGTYYIYTAYGYQAVASPAAVAGTLNSYIINVPNGRGGYTAVILKRSGRGFIGPQGEFYPEFPKISQLKLMYGK